jgi:phage tail-like protein
MPTTTIAGHPRRYDKKFLFAIEIAGLQVSWFHKISSLENESTVIEQFEAGNNNVADQSPGRVKFSPVTLSIGATDNKELYNWRQQVVDASADTGEPDAEYKRNVAVLVLDRNGKEKRRYNLFEAWPSKYVAGEFDAGAEENVVEECTLTYKRFERIDKSFAGGAGTGR